MAAVKTCAECGETLFDFDFNEGKDICIECEEERQESEEPEPDFKSYLQSKKKVKADPKPEKVKKKRGPGRPKGSGNKKPQAPAKPKSPKLDLSKFKKISIAPHICHEPMIKIAVNNKTGNRSFAFNAACIEGFKIQDIAGVDVYVSKNGKGKQIVFAPAEKPTFKINNSKKNQYAFSSRKLFEQLGVEPGSYPVKNVDGLMLVEIEK